MMKKRNQPLLFLGIFVSIFVVFLLVFSLFFYMTGRTKWVTDFFTIRLFYIPFIIYLIVISACVSLFAMLIIYFIRRQQLVILERRIHSLVKGNYDDPVLMEPTYESGDDLYLFDIENDLSKLRKKLMMMSKELQNMANEPHLVSGQTKEQILEEERHRLARELHDSVSQQLFAATMLLSTLNELGNSYELPDVFQKQLDTVTNIINEAQSEMRALLLHLRPVNLEGKSLRKGIEQLLVELQTKIKIKLTWEVQDVQLEKGIEDHLFRIVQELLSNTLRHAKAQSLELYLKKIEQNVLLRMVDDGVGFDMNKEKMGSYGLKNIRERTTGMGGSCHIVSFVGKGTSIEIKVPVIEAREECEEVDKSTVSG